MYYNSEEIDEDLKCSVCQEKFIDVVKLIPDCGESVCDGCYEELKDKVDEADHYKCLACKDEHTMPKKGLPEIKSLKRMIKRRRLEKPLSDEAKMLKSIIGSFPDQIQAVKDFDEREHINHHCDQLEIEVSEEIDSVMRRLNELKESALERIDEYRSVCLSSWATRSGDASTTRAKEELDALAKSLAEFSCHWTDYFNRIDALASDKEVASAIGVARCFERKIRSLMKRQRSGALNGKTMLFKADESVFSDQSPLERIISLPIQDDLIHKAIVQPTPSYTLIGHSDSVNQAVLLPDGRLVSCSDDQSIKIWSLADEAVVHELVDHTDWVFSLVLLWNGLLASGSADKTIVIWDLDARSKIRTLKGHTSSVASLQVLKSGNLVSYSLDDTIKIWNPYSSDNNNNNLLMTIEGHGNTSWLIPFGVLSNDNLVTCSFAGELEDTLSVWHSGTGALVRSIPTGSRTVSALLVLSDYLVVLGFNTGAIKVVPLSAGAGWTVAIKKADADRVHSLARFSVDTMVSCSGSDAPVINVWNLKSWNLIQTISADRVSTVFTVTLPPDEALLVGANSDFSIQLWQANS